MSALDETMEVVAKPKRTPRKQVITENEDSPGEVPPVVKKRAPRKKAAPPVAVAGAAATPIAAVSKPARSKVAKVVDAPARKAPTPIAADRATTRSTRRQAIVVGLLIFVGVGASAAVGYTDKGGINVEQAIAARNERINKGEIQGEILQVQNTPQVADGGLVGLGIGGPENSASSTQATTASSTEATSTQPTLPLTAMEAAALMDQNQSDPAASTTQE